jgi:PBP1b-binding outer membrane lipoprotein LpoB
VNKIGLAVLCLAMLLAGCGGSLHGNASAGPNPGGGFYGAPNIDIGRINP